MPKPQQPSGSSPSTLRIEGEMTIYRATELKTMLLESLAQPSPLEIDLSAVTEIDSAGVQLLVLTKKTAQDRQQEVHFSAHSPAVLDVFELLNLAAYFGDPLVMQSRDAAAGRA